jgi:hypothetical protein
MLIDEGYDADAFALHLAHPLIVEYIVSDGVPDALRARGVASLFDDLVEPVQEVVGQRHPDAH